MFGASGMKIGIIGAGAMGSIFTYFFHNAGIETTLYDIDRSTVDALRNGLRVVAGDTTVSFPVTVTNDPAMLTACDIILVFVKSYATVPAMDVISSVLSPESRIVTLQNGIGNNEAISRYIPVERIVFGTTTIGATKIDRSTVQYGGSVDIVIGGTDMSAVDDVQRAFLDAGLSSTITDNPETAVWKKALINAAINPLGAILSVPNGALLENEYALLLQKSIIEESVAVAGALGMHFDTTAVYAATRDVCVKTSKNLCSMLQDVQSKRKTEIESINGAIVRNGAGHGIETPVNSMVATIIHAIEESYTFSV